LRLRQQRRRHALHPALQVIEANAATQQLTNDQRHPQLRQYLGGERDRAELAVASLLSRAKRLPRRTDRFRF